MLVSMITVQSRKISKHTTFPTTQNAQQKKRLVVVVAVQKAKKALSLSQAARQYDTSKTTLSD